MYQPCRNWALPADAPPPVDLITAALRAATEAIYVGGGTGDPDLLALAEQFAALDARTAVVAFLRALPARFPLPSRTGSGCSVWGATEGWHAMLADAVARLPEIPPNSK
jgi:hypothetical protein